MNIKHSPGPWHDDGYRIYAATDEDDKRNGRVIFEYKHIDNFNDADAALIVAAPRMLDALLACREILNVVNAPLTLHRVNLAIEQATGGAA